MSGFNEVSAMPDLPQGTDETGASATRPMIGAVASQSETPSVPAGTIALAWWDSMKYYWRKSSTGGYHLAPQDEFISDVLDRSDHYISAAASKLEKDDFVAYDRFVACKQNEIEELNAMFQDGVEGLSVLRNLLARAVISRKIAGASAVSAEHRVINELNKPDGNVEALKDDANGFFQSDCEKRERWAEKASLYEYAVAKLADGDVIPNDAKAFAELLAKRVRNSLYDDAVERGNRLKRPTPAAQASGDKPSKAELLALTA